MRNCCSILPVAGSPARSAGASAGHEALRYVEVLKGGRPHRRLRIMKRYHCACPIHRQLLASPVLLAQYQILFPPPPLIQFAEAAVLIAVWGLPGGTPPKATVASYVTSPAPSADCAAVRRTSCLQPVVIPLRAKRPRDLSSFGPPANTRVRLPRPIEQLRGSAADPGPLQTST